MQYTPSELDRIHTQAKAQAHALREQAMADFWRGAYALAYRLARRAQARVQATTPVSIPTTHCEGV
jgi:hypothetical protein